MNTDNQKQKDTEFMQQHTISPAQFKQMIAEKTERARAYSKAVEKKQEIQLEDR